MGAVDDEVADVLAGCLEANPATRSTGPISATIAVR
jgi:hypothetical protein